MCQKQKTLQKMMQLADCNLKLHISKLADMAFLHETMFESHFEFYPKRPSSFKIDQKTIRKKNKNCT